MTKNIRAPSYLGMTTGYLFGRYFRVLPSPEGRSDGDLTVSATSKNCGISLTRFKENESSQVLSIHAYMTSPTTSC